MITFQFPTGIHSHARFPRERCAFLILWISNTTEIGLQWFCPFRMLLVHILVALLSTGDGLFASRKEKIQLELFDSLTDVLVLHQKPQRNKS